ncbi:MAG: 5-formyltetrahydrofolate cyclo-ligase [Devosia sp.]
MTDVTIEEAKAALRARAHQQRATFLQGYRADAAKAAAEHFFAGVTLRPTEMVAAYWPIRDELDCKLVLTRLMDEGQPVCLPVVLGENQPLELRLWEQGAALYPSGFGTLAPGENAPLVEPDVVLMPLLGFDQLGTRLGYGGGYYDRTLAAISRSPRLIGFAFSAQELNHIPREIHDVPLDAVVTEQGVRHFGAPAAAP